MINEEDRGRDRQSSDYSQPNKRKRISTGNKPYDKVDYNRSDDTREKRPLYSSDRSTQRPIRDNSNEYPRENYRRSSDDTRGNSYERRERTDRSPGYNRDYGNERSSGYERRDYGNDRRDYGNDRRDYGNERRDYGNERGYGNERRDSGNERSSGYERRDSGNERNSGYERRGSGYDRNSSGYERGPSRPFTKRPGYGSDQRSGGSFRKPFNKDGRSDFRQRPSSGRPFQRKTFVKPQQPPQRQPIYKVEELPQDVPIRLNKLIANTGLCSRREADVYIQTGLISVNGQLVTELGTKVLPTDEIRYNGERLQAEKKVYILLNKPKDYVTSVDDPHAKRTVMELITGACRERIYPVGRLDRMTTGVLLLTNDGELTKKLTHPTSNIRKIYQVHLDKSLKPEDLQAVSDGITLDDGFIRIDGISYINDDDRSLVGVEIHSGRNRIVRRVFEHFGYKVTKLDRVYFAGLTKKSLQRGMWRYLDPKEVGFLKMMKS